MLQSYTKKIAIGFTLTISSLTAFADFNPAPPVSGAYQTGIYRNILAEFGKSSIQNRVDESFNKMFYGTSDEKLYYEFDNDEAYIKAIGSNDIRSEGQSWGMTIAVMMDKKEEFDKLWRFAHDRMKNDNSQSFPGTYAWQLRDNGGSVSVLDHGAAPDGELYFAFALFNAAHRWGSGTGIYNYEAQANTMLDVIRNNLMDNSWKQIVFSPFENSFTDPSYHVPAFLDYFADVANSNNSYWSDAAESSRIFLQMHLAHGNGGLSTYLAGFDGAPKQGNSIFSGQPNPGDIYESDSFRVIKNIAMDAHMMGAEAWHTDAVDTLLNFFKQEGMSSGGPCGNGYGQKYWQSGVAYGSSCGENGNYGHDAAQKAANAAAVLASTNSNDALLFVNDFWNQSWPTGQYRYYNGSLYMLGMLHLSGNFKFYKPGSNNSSSSSSASGSNTIQVRMVGTDGTESVTLEVGGTAIKTWTLSTTMTTYTASTDLNGEIRVDYTNDASGRDVQVDYIVVNGETRQAEDQDDNTGVWGNDACGGGTLSEMLHCSGSIGFGPVGNTSSSSSSQPASSSSSSSSSSQSSSSSSSSQPVSSSSSSVSSSSSSSSTQSGSNTIEVRMAGVDGTESVTLQVGGVDVETWILSTSMSTYSVTTDLSGEIRVDYTNDATGRDVQVDYIVVNGDVRQAEDQDDNTGVWGNGSCGGGTMSEMLHCSGSIGFGNVDSTSVSSSSSSVASSSSSAPSGGMCNWYGSQIPLCQNTQNGWGWENNQSCVSVNTCNSQ